MLHANGHIVGDLKSCRQSEGVEASALAKKL